MRVLTRVLIVATVVTCVSAAPAAAQTPILPIVDHIHLNVPDQVMLVQVTVTPEPSGMLVLGANALLIRRRRRSASCVRQ